MCIAIISFCELDDWPLLVASNRDEYYDRPSLPPLIERSGEVTWLAPRDDRAGGTWVGINQCGVFAVITNRSDLDQKPPPGACSRGLLVRDILRASSVEKALKSTRSALARPSAPFNLIFGDSRRIYLVARTNERTTR